MTVWITLGALTIPHSEDVPTIQTAGSQMSFVLQPFNYFDTDPSQHVPDAVRVSASSRHPGALVYRRHGDSDAAARDRDCVPVVVRTSGAETNAGRVVVIALMMAAVSLIG